MEVKREIVLAGGARRGLGGADRSRAARGVVRDRGRARPRPGARASSAGRTARSGTRWSRRSRKSAARAPLDRRRTGARPGRLHDRGGRRGDARRRHRDRAGRRWGTALELRACASTRSHGGRRPGRSSRPSPTRPGGRSSRRSRPARRRRRPSSPPSCPSRGRRSSKHLTALGSAGLVASSGAAARRTTG